ncbi:MAG TPA: hypothetical protein VIZ65_07825 [Cellvibrionaceae bacterium]
MEYVVKKIDAALVQLDCAIRLFLDEEDYISAITLSGAAEEIIGEVLGSNPTFSHLNRK